MDGRRDVQDAPPVVGGQAVVGGVLMRNGRRWCVAVRREDGCIVSDRGELPESSLPALPVWRGAVALWSGLRLGTRALVWSAQQQLAEHQRRASVALLPAALVPVVVFGVVFMAVPAAVAALVGGAHLTQSLVEGVVRLAMVLGYVWGVGRMPQIAEVFRYHGAEHKVVNAYEAGEELSVASARRRPIVHQRCGTSFVVLVVAVSQLVFAVLPRWSVPLTAVSRLVALPLVAGAAFELLRFLARHEGRRWAAVVAAPGLWVQSLTTNEPTDAQVEVALAALAGCTDELPDRDGGDHSPAPVAAAGGS